VEGQGEMVWEIVYLNNGILRAQFDCRMIYLLSASKMVTTRGSGQLELSLVIIPFPMLSFA
jgi:hypothetical protein